MDNVNKENVKAYLDMQRREYYNGANLATITKENILNEVVVGNYNEHEKFPYDEHILKHLQKDTKECVTLEYGCGPGRNLKRMAHKFNKIIGIDICQKNIDNAKKFLSLNNIDNFELYTNNGNDIPIPNETVDIAFEVICFQHICSYTIRKDILKEMRRVLKKRGLIVLEFGFNNLIKQGHVDYFTDYLINTPGTNGACDCCVTDKTQITNDLEEIGFKIIDVWFTDPVMDCNHDKWIWCCGEKL